MFTVGGHCTVVEGRSPFLVRADAVTILKVEPGGKMPCSARSNPPGRSITARTRPVEGWSTTMSTGLAVAAAETACEAASWYRRSRLVWTLWPGVAGNRMAVASTFFPGPSIRMISAGRPASRDW